MHCCSDNPTSARQYASRFVRDCAHISRPVPLPIPSVRGVVGFRASVFNTLIVGGDLVGNLVGWFGRKDESELRTILRAMRYVRQRQVAMSESAYIRS